MVTVITDTLCSDDPYTDDLHRIAPLSHEEQQTLIDCIARAQLQGFPPSTAQQVEEAKQRLFEGHLRIARHMAYKLCPPSKRALVPDLIQEANIGLMEALSSYDFVQGWNLSAFATGCIRTCVLRAIAKEKLITVKRSEYACLRKEGTLDQLYAIQPLSLDRMFASGYDDETNLYSLLAAPADLPVSPAENTAQQEQIEALLTTLPPRPQQVLRLAYGLTEDQVLRSSQEIAALLGLAVNTVKHIQHQALRRLHILTEMLPGVSCAQHEDPQTRLEQASRHLFAQGKPLSINTLALSAGVAWKTARRFLHPPHTEEVSLKPPRTPRRAPSHKSSREQQRPSLARMPHAQRLAMAYTPLVAEGQTINGSTLARLAGVHYHTACKFLRRRATETMLQMPATSRERLEQAYAQLGAERRKISGYALACLADVRWQAARTFLQERQGVCIPPSHPRSVQQRLEESYTRLQGQEAPITVTHLAREAQVHTHTASKFLQRHGEPYASRQQITQARHTRLTAACLQLQAEGKPVYEHALARAAGVSRKSARAYLHPHDEGDKQQSCTERLARAYACFQSEGTPITINALAMGAGVHWNTARKFLQQQPAARELQAVG